MAIAVIGEIPGGNAEMDDRLMRSMGASADNPPAGAVVRLAGPTDGGWRIISVWESEDAWNAFRQDKLEPSFREMGQQMPPVQLWELHDVRLALRG